MNILNQQCRIFIGESGADTFAVYKYPAPAAHAVSIGLGIAFEHDWTNDGTDWWVEIFDEADRSWRQVS